MHDGAPSPEDSYASVRDLIDSVEHWYHRIEVLPGLVTPGTHDSQEALRHLSLPEDCSGLRVLDIGARDGFFSFELERRGAEVLAIDYVPPDQTGFAVAKRVLGSRVQFMVDNVYNLSRERHGAFDLVLFLGVLYHLRDPLLALDRIWEVCRERLLVETQVLDNAFIDGRGAVRRLVDVAPALADAPIAQFYPDDTLGGEYTNWWSPSARCLAAMLEAAGFTVESQTVVGPRAIASATKALDPERLHHRQIEKSVFTESRNSYQPPDWLLDRLKLFEESEREKAVARARQQRLEKVEGELGRCRAELEDKQLELDRILADLARSRWDLEHARADRDQLESSLKMLRASRLFRYTAHLRRLYYRRRAGRGERP